MRGELSMNFWFFAKQFHRLATIRVKACVETVLYMTGGIPAKNPTCAETLSEGEKLFKEQKIT